MKTWQPPQGTQLLSVLAELQAQLETSDLLPVVNADRRKRITAALVQLDQSVHGLLRQLGKQCSTCRQVLEPEAFYRDVTRPDGLTARCKVCTRAARRFAGASTS